MKSSAPRDNFPWESFLVHWGPIAAPFVIGLGAYVFLFLLNLSGSEWTAVFWTGLALAVAGAGLIFRARLPLYRQRRFFTFGSRCLPAASLPFYRWGYRLYVPGVLLLLGASLACN